jgi:hypothetical protein
MNERRQNVMHSEIMQRCIGTKSISGLLNYLWSS